MDFGSSKSEVKVSISFLISKTPNRGFGAMTYDYNTLDINKIYKINHVYV